MPKAKGAEVFRTTAGLLKLREVRCRKRSIGFDVPCKRNLLTKEQVEALKPLIEKLSPTLNAYLRSIGTKYEVSKDEGQKTKDDS